MTDNPREARVLAAVVSLVDSLLDDFDVVDLLTELTERCADLLDVGAAGFLLADPLGELRLLAATSTQTRELEVLQVHVDEGPCVECYATGQPISVADLRTESGRWPQFVPAALGAGIVSVHAVPMRAAGIVLGSLGLFGNHTGRLSESDLLVAQTLAHVACVAILQEHPPTPATVIPQLRSALTNRIVVDQAKGFLRERLDISVDQAFSLLRRYARAHGEHLTDVSRQLVSDAGARPTLMQKMTQLVHG